eukprot:CAMPEP_0194065980 /NCGR_PEP_ID=MMETSP0009_2-20130614/85757_1 /TAXON_ID=210454 /ORGANISM="Grammatophora oceanica, Strain CCMP 410" /LENGTH=676 /DNA_ID=CAMNT_0038718887 /DNA_START=2223 /DNA_END=4254 /DNA_ORIENTATION=-
MVTTLPVLLLFAIIICVCTGIARGDTGIDADTGSDSFGSGGSSSCAADSDCWSSFDDIKAQIEGDATEMNRTIIHHIDPFIRRIEQIHPAIISPREEEELGPSYCSDSSNRAVIPSIHLLIDPSTIHPSTIHLLIIHPSHPEEKFFRRASTSTMVTTLPFLLLFAIIICVCMGIAHGDRLGADDTNNGCGAGSDCWSSFDDIKAQIEGDATEIPVCHGESIEFKEAIDVSGKNFHLFTANCDGSIKHDELLESATFVGTKIFSATNADSDHEITISGVNFISPLIYSRPVRPIMLDNGGKGTLTVSGCTFQGQRDSTVRSVAGHAISNGEYATVSISDCSFNDHPGLPTDPPGAAISNYGQVTIKESSFSANYCYQGGAIYNKDGTMTIESSTFTSNYSLMYGGAIYVDGGTTEIKSSEFFHNEASRGGAIFVNAGTLKISKNTFKKTRDAAGLTDHVNIAEGGDVVECLLPNTFLPAGSEPNLPAGCTLSPLCNTVIETSTTLSEDVLCNCDAESTPLITLGKSRITLDMNGYTVKCTDSSTTMMEACIRVMYRGNTVKNGVVSNCATGIDLSGRGYHTVTQVSVEASTVGMVVNSINSEVLYNTIVASEGGIDVAGNNALIEGNTVSVAEGFGIGLQDGKVAEIVDNIVTVTQGECFFGISFPPGNRGNTCNGV